MTQYHIASKEWKSLSDKTIYSKYFFIYKLLYPRAELANRT